jgi:hypothetical protein
VSADASLRVRLEGRLEVLETAASTLEALDRLLRSGNWWSAVAQTRQHLGQWVVMVQPRLGEAIEAARRANGAEVLARLARAQARLARSLHRHLARTAVARAGTLDRQLEAWLRLSEHTGLPQRSGPELAEASVNVHPRGWIGILALCGVMLLLSRPGEATCLLLLAGASWQWVKQRVRYRLFTDALVVEREGEASVEVPLRTFELRDASPGLTLQALVDVEFPLAEGFPSLCTQLNTLFSERELLEQERRVLAPFAATAGHWLTASLQPPQAARPVAVEVFKFGKDTGASPMESKALLESNRAPLSGSVLIALPTSSPPGALISDRGLLFVAHSAEPKVRKVLFDTQPVRLLREDQTPLTSFPEALMLERLDALSRLPEVHWVALAQELSWTSEGEFEVVALAAGRLSVKVDERSRGVLRSIWPPR